MDGFDKIRLKLYQEYIINNDYNKYEKEYLD